MKKTIFIFVLFCILANAQPKDAISNENFCDNNAIEYSPFFSYYKIYSLQYNYEFSPGNTLILGGGYQNINYDFGTTHAPCLILGYKRTLWKELSAEYCIWPAYNSFHEDKENKDYNDFEMWNEVRISYEIGFNIGGVHMFALPQLVVGCGLFSGDKPQSFKDYYKDDEPVFIRPNISFGFKF